MIDSTFSRTLRYQSKAEPASLLADLTTLQQQSDSAQIWRRVWIGVLIVVVLAAVIVLFASAALLETGHGSALAILFFLLGGDILLLWWLQRRNRRRILDNYLLKRSAILVRHLSCDLLPGDKLELRVSFQGYYHSAYQMGSPVRSRYQVTTYRTPWLSVRGTLADGSRLSLDSAVLAKRKVRYKRKGQKTKEDLCEQVTLTLQVPSLPAQSRSRWVELVQTARLAGHLRVRKAQVRGEKLILQIRTRHFQRVTDRGKVLMGADLEKKVANPHTLLLPLLAAYRSLASCRGPQGGSNRV